MTGTTELRALLKSLSPTIAEEDYVFVTVGDRSQLNGLDAICVFREREGITAICGRVHAERAALVYDGTFRQITLAVHSSLQAVGLLAAVSAALAEAGIPCNAVSAFYHDHIFVPADLAARALDVLSLLEAKYRNT